MKIKLIILVKSVDSKMAIKFGIIFIILLFHSVPVNYAHAALPNNVEHTEKVKIEKKNFSENKEKTFKSLKEAEEHLRCLQKQRKTLTGDFYGINITAYCYANIFYPMGYIHYRIDQIDKEIEKVKLEIDKLKDRWTGKILF
jgi:hypothetical protein